MGITEDDPRVETPLLKNEEIAVVLTVSHYIRIYYFLFKFIAGKLSKYKSYEVREEQFFLRSRQSLNW
jgi:hypothetical protein